MKNETELLQECKIQLEYLNEKFGATGTTNALLAKINAVLPQANVIGQSEQLKCDEHKSAEWRSTNLGYGSKGEMVYIK